MNFRKTTPEVPITRDILMEKQGEQSRLLRQANDSVRTFTAAMEELESINEQIDIAINEIDSYIKDLSATRNAMNDQRKSNTAIIGNITKFFDAGNKPV